MRTRLIALVIAAAILVSGLAGCDETPVINVSEAIGVDDSLEISQPTEISITETIGVSDSPQSLSSAIIGVTESVIINDSASISLSLVVNVTETIHISDLPALTPVPPPPSQVAVMVTSPKAGEIWRMGTMNNILWSTIGEGIAYVDIYYSTDAGYSMINVARIEANDGIYSWNVPNTPTKTALVRVLAFNAKGETLALGDSGLFSISTQ